MLKNFKFVHEENRMANVVRFSVETIQGMEIWKTSGYFFGRVFPQSVFQRKQYRNRFSLIFRFASFDSFKPLTGGCEKLDFLSKRFGLWKD